MTDGLVSGEGCDPLAERLARTLPRLRAHLARRGGVEPDDLAQEVLARALRLRRSFDEARALWPWLRRMADRAWSDRLAAEARRPRALDEHEPSAPESAHELDQRDEVERLLAALPEREREVLLRFHRDGLSIAAIAAETGQPEGTIKSCLHRARRRLAEGPRREDER